MGEMEIQFIQNFDFIDVVNFQGSCDTVAL